MVALPGGQFQISPDSYGLSVGPSGLLPANCFSATSRYTKANVFFDTNTNPGAWHFGQTVRFSGSEEQCKKAGNGDLTTYSGAKTSTLILPEGFAW